MPHGVTGPPGPINPPENEYSPPPGSGLHEPINGWDDVGYALYVEEVVLPDTIHENEPFQITMRVSAEFRPVVLLGCRWQWTGVFVPIHGDGDLFGPGEFAIWPPGYLEDEYVSVVDLPSSVTNPPGKGPKQDLFVFNVPGLPAGKHLIEYQNLTDRRLGGIGAPRAGPPYGYLGGDPEWYDPDSFVMVQLPLTVLPAEDGAEE